MADVKQDNRVVHYFKETRAELKKVNWPTRTEARNLTLIVLVVTIFMATLLRVFDLLAESLLKGVLVDKNAASVVVLIVLSVIGLGALVVALRRQ